MAEPIGVGRVYTRVPQRTAYHVTRQIQRPSGTIFRADFLPNVPCGRHKKQRKRGLWNYPVDIYVYEVYI